MNQIFMKNKYIRSIILITINQINFNASQEAYIEKEVILSEVNQLQSVNLTGTWGHLITTE